MRAKQKQLDFLKREIEKVVPGSKIYLFGSRVDDNQKGGDLDILILSKEKIHFGTTRRIKISFYREFGYQKLDLVNFRFDEESPFKELVLLEGEKL